MNGPRFERDARTSRSRERGAALVMVVFFTFLAVSFSGLLLQRAHVELADGRLKQARVKSLFGAHSALARAHAEINDGMDSFASLAAGENVVLADPESHSGYEFVTGTNRAVQVRTVKPSSSFDGDGAEIEPGAGYEDLPDSWYCLEARISEPLYTRADGTRLGQLKLVRQYVRDGTPLSNNFLAVIDDDLGLGGAPVNPGKPAEGEIQTNKHLYIMTPNPYYANRLLAVDGVSYTAGATESGTVYLHPDNNFEADPLVLPLPSSLTSNPSDPSDTLKNHALGTTPTNVSLATSNVDYPVQWNGISGLNDLKASSGHPQPSVKLNYDDEGHVRGVHVEGYVNHEVVMDGATFTLKIMKHNDPNKYVRISGLPSPDIGVMFFDTRVDLGGVAARTKFKGEVSTRMTMATTASVDITGSIRYADDDGDHATKLVLADDLDGVADADLGTVPEISDSDSIGSSDDVAYFANKRPPGVEAVDGDGFYDADAVLGVVASQDVIFTTNMPQNAEIAGSFLSLQKRLTLEGLTYNSSGALTGYSTSSAFYKNNGGRSSLRRFGGMISYKRPCSTVVASNGSFLYGFKRGFSLFDEDMKQKPPPFFPKDKRPQYLGWELKDLGVKAIAGL
jgi:hypothetical protein